jgi:ketosteroid isomerase-like protein
MSQENIEVMRAVMSAFAREDLPAFLPLTDPDIRDLGDQVLVLGTLRLNGRESGVQMENPLAMVARFREGPITHLKDYADRGQALEAAGLSE